MGENEGKHEAKNSRAERWRQKMKIQSGLMPDHEDIEFKPDFIERYKRLTDFGQFRKYSLSFPRKSIRVNTLKMTADEVRKRLEKEWRLEQIPWCREGFWIEHKGEGENKRRDVGNLIEHALGYIYVQDAASMIPPMVLGPQTGEKVLDIAAAPGSKTTQIAQMMKNKGIIVANDISADRLASLGINLQRMGVMNTVINKAKGHLIKETGFDRILVDAPCSATGTIRRSIKTLQMWNPNIARRLAGEQKRLLQHAFRLLKQGGTIVYSTCTMEPEEDEGVIDWLLSNNENAELEDIDIKGLKRSEAVTGFNGKEYDKEVRKCLRIWPQDNDTEGFFITKIKKLKERSEAD
ncbi:MAG: RsmB/NOP family class I SAM-dependent RNA methyltransferase [Candidatus Woesearchaeota archaeon]